MDLPFPTMKNKEAADAGYIAITTPFCQHHASPEREWFQHVLSDMKGCNCVIVPFTSGLEIWRHHTEINLDHNGVRRAGPGDNMHVPKRKKNETSPSVGATEK